jgi:hypothetical protein
MKSSMFACITALSLLGVLAIPAQLAAQDKQNHNNSNQHHHYKLIDIGTFGGPARRND